MTTTSLPLPAPVDDAAFARELDSLYPRLRGLARRLTFDPVQADDLVQDTMMRAWAARASFAMGSNMRAWTSTILRRIHLTNLRRQRFVGTYSEELERTLSYAETQSATVEVGEVRHAFDQLPDDQRAALSMIALEQVSYEQAAHRLAVPVNTVKSRVSRARKALERMLSGALRTGGTPPVTETMPTVELGRSRRGGTSPKLLALRQARLAGRPFLIG